MERSSMRCECGQELGEEGLHACPSCGEIVDPAGPAEKAIQVDGRMLPVRAWEGEVLLRGAAWVAGLHAASLALAITAFPLGSLKEAVRWLLLVLFVVGVTALLLRRIKSPLRRGLLVSGVGAAWIALGATVRVIHSGTLMIAIGALLACPVALGVTRRSRVAAIGLAVICVGWLWFLLAESSLMDPTLTLDWLFCALSALPPLFCLAAILGKPGRTALGDEYAGQPLAPLASVRLHPASPLGWASVGFVALSWIFAVWLVAPWLYSLVVFALTS